MGYAYYVDGAAYAYRVDTETGEPQRFQRGTLAWVPMRGLGELMAKISNGDAQPSTERAAMRTVEVIKRMKAHWDAGGTTAPSLLELQMAAEVDAGQPA